jgi:hypothetical protein
MLVICLFFKQRVVTCFESNNSEIAFLGQRIWNFVGNQLVEAHIHGNVQVTETELLQEAYV